MPQPTARPAAELPLLADGIANQVQFRPPFTGDLAGQGLRLVNAPGDTQEYRFIDQHTLERIVGQAVSTRHYDATRVRPGIYLVDLLVEDVAIDGAVAGLVTAETWALDTVTHRVIIGRSWPVVVDDAGTIEARTTYEHWSIDDAGTNVAYRPHERSAGMVGHRVLWRYSDTDRYDHVYFTPDTFLWQCVDGVEQGMSEYDRTVAFEIADDLYFFGWSEHVQCVESMLFVDLSQLKTFGRMYGWEPRTSTVLHHQFGGVGQILNITTYPEKQ